jgi:hypothetical protein
VAYVACLGAAAVEPLMLTSTTVGGLGRLGSISTDLRKVPYRVFHERVYANRGRSRPTCPNQPPVKVDGTDFNPV